MVRSRASHRLSWPVIMFSQSGVFASSKSASHTFAPELSALMVIFRSVGPVISTRRSTRPGAGAGTQQLRPLAAELTLERGDQAQRVRGEDLLETISGRAKDLNAITSRHLPLLFCAGMWN